MIEFVTGQLVVENSKKKCVSPEEKLQQNVGSVEGFESGKLKTLN